MDLEIKELQSGKPFAPSNRKRVISCEPATYKRAKVSPPVGSSVHPQGSQYAFSDDDIQKCLFSKSCIKPVISQDLMAKSPGFTCFWCDAGSTNPNFTCPRHKHETPVHQHNTRLSLALRSLPPEVELCVSSIPGEGYGVCAKHLIPVGAWIGPYEGKYLRPEDLPLFADTSYMWEIFKDGELVGFVDGSDEKVSSWMRFIRCARHKQEQNLFAFQYLGKVYYRAFKAIQPGEEMLVWYDDKYQQYLGLPSVMFDMATIRNAGANFPPEKSGTVLTKTDNSSSTETLKASNQFPPSPPSSVPSPSSPASPDSQPSSPTKSSSSEPISDQQIKVTSAFDFSSASINREGPQFPPSPPLSSPGSIRSETASPNHYENESRILPTAQKPAYTGVTELSLWKCGQCKKSFPQRIMLQVHVCNESPKKPYQCGHCTQSFSSPAHLRAHAVTHVSKKPFKCGYCSRAFAGATTLNNHIRTHTGEKPFVCDKCGKNFTQGSQLSRHQRIPGDCVKQE